MKRKQINAKLFSLIRFNRRILGRPILALSKLKLFRIVDLPLCCDHHHLQAGIDALERISCPALKFMHAIVFLLLESHA
ncbi:hypothetical protein T08_15435 [Trichinella sp. T8]|nr:hypothetical protein T08_15435 [Trichinella sp. T8]